MREKAEKQALLSKFFSVITSTLAGYYKYPILTGGRGVVGSNPASPTRSATSFDKLEMKKLPNGSDGSTFQGSAYEHGTDRPSSHPSEESIAWDVIHRHYRGRRPRCLIDGSDLEFFAGDGI